MERPATPTAAPPVVPQAAQPPARTDDTAGDVNAARVSRGLQNAVHQQGGTVTLRLTPAELGTVRIQMHMQGTTVSANFHTETESAQALLTQQITHLRQALETQGLTVERLQVQTMPSSGFTQSGTGGQQQNDTAGGDGRSRGFLGGDNGRQAGGGGGGQDERRRDAFSRFLADERN